MSCLPALAGVCPHPMPVRRDIIILTESTLIVAGADTHADTLHVAAISMTGAALGDREFPTTRTGYATAIRFLTSWGQIERIGVEGTASYGAGFTRALSTAGIEVVEVTRAVKSTRRLNPGLRAAYGVGSDTAAQLLITAGANPHRLHSEAAFAALCGAAPVPASSGKTNRHRLSRGGDRAANNALHRIALVRMSHHQPTKDYVQRQLALGHNRMEILRKLKRAIAREIFKLLTRQIAVPEYADLRPARQAKNITVTAAANHFGIWPTVISRIERGLQRDDTFADTYRNWLRAA